MPNDKTEFDLEKLKTDSQMWMRLAMSVEGSDRLENVFPGTKNPFEEYGDASIEKVRKLADEGKLYVREFGRSRHFRQVEKDGDKLNLGDTKEIRVNTTYSDPALAVLMYLSRAFFKGSAIDRFFDWIGLGSISGWFDKRLEHRRELIDKEERYKQEYNSMTDDQKEKLKELRANEKEVAKIQKELQKQAKLEAEARENLKNLEEQTNSIRRKLNQLQGKEDTGNSNEMTAPLTQPAPPQDQPTMQPILEGDPNQLDKKQEQPPQDTKKTEHPTADTKKTEQEEKKKGITLVSGDKVYTDENLNELPEEVRKMLEMIQKAIDQMETQKKQEQLQQNPQPTDLQNEQEQQQQQQQQPQTDLNAVNNEEQQNVNENAENPRTTPQGEDEQLQEQAEAVPEDWRDMIANALFSHGQGTDLMEQYQQVQDDRENSAIFLAGAIYGVLKASTLDPEGNQKMLEDIFNGRSLGDEKNDLIRAGLDTAQNAMQKSNEQNDNTQMEEMLTTAITRLKEFAGDGNAVTPQRAMAIMMVSLAEGLALDLGVQLPQKEVAPRENLPNPEGQEELQEVDLQPLFQDVEEEPQAETNVPLNQPAKAVPEDWRDMIANALFSHDRGADLLAQYQQVKDNLLDSAIFLAGAICGMLKAGILDRETNQKLLEDIFNGRSLGDEKDDLIRAGLNTAQDAMQKSNEQNDNTQLEEMLTTAVTQLKEFAGDGNATTPQQAIAAIIAEQAQGLAKDFGIQLSMVETNAPQPQTDLNAVNNEEQQNVNENAENPRTTLQDENEQLQEQAEAVPEDWRDMIATALFSHGQGADLMEQYQQVQDDRENSAIFLAGAIYGVLKASTLDPEGNQKMLEDIFNGRSLGDEKNDLIRAGLDTAQNAMQKSNEQNDNTQMEEMLTTAITRLKEFAGDGNAVTPQRAMAIMMVSLAEGLALDLDVQLPQKEVAPRENLPNPEGQEELQEVDLQLLFQDVEEPQAETNVPLNQPAEIEPEQVNIQPEPEKPEQEEILENEQAVPEDWRDVLVKALFSHENGVDLLAQYQQVKDNPLDSAVFLASAIFGILKENIIDREPNQNLLEQIFNGRSLGNGNDDLVRNGMESAQDAMRKCEAQEDLQPLEKMLTIAVRELKEYAGDGNEPTPQQAMAAMMAEIAEGFARDFGVQLPQEEAAQQQLGDQEPQAQQEAPLAAPPNMEEDKIKIQNREPETQPLTLPERLEAERKALEAAKHWRDTMSNSLFSYQGGEDLKNGYTQMRSNARDASDYLTLTVMGLIANGPQKNGGEQNHKELMDALLDGRPIGAEQDNFVRGAANRAKELMQNPNLEQTKDLLADAVRGLGWQAAEEPNLSGRHVMIGMLITSALTMATHKGLNLTLGDTDNRIVKCAAEMGKIARSYGNARQYFGSHPLDQTDETCRTQLQNLLAGNAVDKAIKLDRKEGQNGVTNTHTLIGGGAWTEANLRTMSQTSRVRTGITPEQLQEMLERPDGKIAQKAGYNVGKEMFTGAQTLLSGNQLDLHQNKTLAQAILDPQVQPNQFIG